MNSVRPETVTTKQEFDAGLELAGQKQNLEFFFVIVSNILKQRVIDLYPLI